MENDNRLHSKYNNAYSKFKQKMLKNKKTVNNNLEKENNIDYINNNNVPQKINQ